MQPFKLRAHHGLCLGFFRGKGYSGEFVENMARVKAAMEENPLICLTVGADGICAACPNHKAGRCETEEKVTRYDRQTLLRCGLSPGEVMPYRAFEARVRGCVLLPGLRREICGDCQWDSLCHEKSEGI